MAERRRRDLLPTLALLWVAAIFGTSFVIVKGGLDFVDPIPYLAIRFGIAGAVLWRIGRRRPPSPGMARLGWATGATYALAMALQTFGLRTIDASSSAFLTYLLVVLVPLITWMWQRRPPEPTIVVAVAVAVAGLALLTGGGVGFTRGAVLTLLGAVAFSVHLIQIGLAATRGHDLYRFNAFQCLVVVALLGPLVPFTGGLPTNLEGWAVGLYAGIVVTVLTTVPWMWAQRHVSPTRAALLLLAEPVFAALAAYATGVRLTPTAIVGAALILAGALLAEVPALRRPGRHRADEVPLLP